jgi:hypothetical protein
MRGLFQQRSKSGEMERELERLGEPSDHDAGLTLRKGRENKIGWICPRCLCGSRKVWKGYWGIPKPKPPIDDFCIFQEWACNT